MKTAGRVKQRAKQAAFRHQKRYIKLKLAPTPENCKWNSPVEAPTGEVFGICTYRQGSEGWNRVLCDSKHGGKPLAMGCEFFETLQSPEELKEEFQQKVGMKGGSVDLKDLSKSYPDLAALYWVLTEDGD